MVRCVRRPDRCRRQGRARPGCTCVRLDRRIRSGCGRGRGGGSRHRRGRRRHARAGREGGARRRSDGQGAPQDRHRTPPQRSPPRGLVAVRPARRPAERRADDRRGRHLEPHRRGVGPTTTTRREPRSTPPSRRCAKPACRRRCCHIAASAASFARSEFRYDMVRIGAFCYGIRPAGGPSETDLGHRPIALARGEGRRRRR